MIPQGCAMEAPQYQVMICVVPGVLDSKILEHMMVCPNDVARPGPHLSSEMGHSQRLFISLPQKLVWEEIICHVI